MEFDRAVEICKEFAPNGLLLDGMENMKSILDEMDNGLLDGNSLTPTEELAFRTVIREMRPLFL